MATATPSLINPIEDFMATLSAASRPAIGASMMMKPTMVPSRPSFISVSEAMARGDDVENDDQARNIGAIGDDHQVNEAVSPQQYGGEYGETSKDHPVQQRPSLRRLHAG